MTDEHTADYVIERLAELLVVLLRDHIGHDAAAEQIRKDSEAILLVLGNVAAKHGRADLMPLLHGIAHKIEQAPRSVPGTPKPTLASLNPALVRRVSFQW